MKAAPGRGADPGHVVVTGQRHLPGVAEHLRALVIEGGQRPQAAVVRGAGHAPVGGRAAAGQRQRVVQRAGAGQLVQRRVDEPERRGLALLRRGHHAGHQRGGHAGPADRELAVGRRLAALVVEGEVAHREPGERVGVGADVRHRADRAAPVARRRDQGRRAPRRPGRTARPRAGWARRPRRRTRPGTASCLPFSREMPVGPAGLEQPGAALADAERGAADRDRVRVTGRLVARRSRHRRRSTCRRPRRRPAPGCVLDVGQRRRLAFQPAAPGVGRHRGQRVAAGAQHGQVGVEQALQPEVALVAAVPADHQLVRARAPSRRTSPRRAVPRCRTGRRTALPRPSDSSEYRLPDGAGRPFFLA